MSDPQKKNRSSVNLKEKDPLQDLDMGNDFFSWKPISIAEGDGLDFDLTPVSNGNRKTFSFDKADMDFNLDADFGKMSSFKLDMSDLAVSPPNRTDAKLKEKLQESSSGKNKEKTDRFAFGFDFDDLDNFSFDSLSKKEGTKAQKEKNKKESSRNGSGCQDKDGSIYINETGSKSTSKDASKRPPLPESRIIFDMDLEPTRELSPSNLAMDDSVTPVHSAVIDEGATDNVKGPPETKSSREMPNSSPSKSLVSPRQVDLEVCTKYDTMLDLSSDYLPKNEPSGGISSAVEEKVDYVDTKASGAESEQNANRTLDADSTCNYKHTISANSQQHQAVAVSENIDETSGDHSSVAERKVNGTCTNVSNLNGKEDANKALVAGSTFDYAHTSKASQHHQTVVVSEDIDETSGDHSSAAERQANCVVTNVSNLNGEEDVNKTLVSGSTCDYEHTSKATEHHEAVAFSENISGKRTQDGIENLVEDDRGRTELGQSNSRVENTGITGAVSNTPCDAQSTWEDQEPSQDILKSSLICQPSDPVEKPIENIKESLIVSSLPLIQSERPVCPVLKASTQSTFSSSSNKQMGFAQPSLVKGRNADSTQSDRKLSLQCSKTLLRGIIHQTQSQKSSSGLKICGATPITDGLLNGNKSNDSSTTQVKDMVKTKSASRQGGMCTKDLDTLSMESSSKAAETCGNPKVLPSVLLNKNTAAQEHRSHTIEGGRKPPDLSGLKLSRLSIASTRSPTLQDSKSAGNSSQKSGLVSKKPSGIAHLPDKCKQTTSTLSVKRTLEDAAAETSALHPSKRLSPSVATSSALHPSKRLSPSVATSSALHPSKHLSPSVATSRNFVETAEKILEKKAPIHNRKEDDRIKRTTGNCQVIPLCTPHEVKTKEVEELSLAKYDSNIKLAEACSKGLDDLCDTLRKQLDEAKELLVKATVNNNKLLLLNDPQFDEKIRETQNLFARITLKYQQH